MDYELLTATRPDLPAEQSKKIAQEVEEFAEKNGGKVARTESLGVKSLSYPVKGLNQAQFSRFIVSLAPDKISELRRQLERDETLLRVFIVKLEGGEVVKNGKVGK